jgi:hypothetical protein
MITGMNVVTDDRRAILDELGILKEDQPATERDVEHMLWQKLAKLTDVAAQQLAHRVATRVTEPDNGAMFEEVYERVLGYIQERAFSPEGTPHAWLLPR